MTTPAVLGSAARGLLLGRALQLAVFTVLWNVVEGVVALAAATAAASVVLLAFGLESFVESASGGVIVWRALMERKARDPEHLERIERRAQRLVAASLALLAAYIAYRSGVALLLGERPGVSVVGVALLVASLLVMGFLARAKSRVARRLESRSMQSDAVQTSTCFWLSLIALAGIGLNALLGWWWADPLAALVLLVPLAREAKDAWEGKACCAAC